MWYLLTDRLTAGLAQLGDKLGSPWSGVFNANATAKNVHAERPDTVPQPKLSDATISRARSRVAMAQALFQFATDCVRACVAEMPTPSIVRLVRE